ncbi:hypothetical protein EVAR_50266_1 [Eumeta japonica]|uniref:Uncharacterized protein n=1 Tax=Eumeta variegata TaxID=151549 RepID=A0A4C1Y624_EUMVA|nr:hypothetical protein EVAR_50266_1 [Eumeta japonica]
MHIVRRSRIAPSSRFTSQRNICMGECLERGVDPGHTHSFQSRRPSQYLAPPAQADQSHQRSTYTKWDIPPPHRTEGVRAGCYPGTSTCKLGAHN